ICAPISTARGIWSAAAARPKSAPARRISGFGWSDRDRPRSGTGHADMWRVRMNQYKIANRTFRGTIWPLLAAGAIFCAVDPANADEQKPNIVFMFMDNLGYGELGVYGGGILRGAPTRRIDKLAGEGMRLLNFNVESQCTPSRSALMTGRFPIRTGTY